MLFRVLVTDRLALAMMRLLFTAACALPLAQGKYLIEHKGSLRTNDKQPTNRNSPAAWLPWQERNSSVGMTESYERQAPDKPLPPAWRPRGRK